MESASLEKKFCEKLRDLNRDKVSGNIGAYYAGIEKALLDYVREKYNSGLSDGDTRRLPGDLQVLCAECRTIGSKKVRFSGYKPQGDEQDRLVRGLTKYMKSLIPAKNEEDSIKTIDTSTAPNRGLRAADTSAGSVSTLSIP